MRSRLRWSVPLAMACLLLSGCVAPAPTDSAYESKAWRSLDDAGSAVATSRIAAQLALRNRIMSRYLDVTVTKSENSIGSIIATFGSVQPPSDAADKSRDEVGALLNDADDAVSSTRIAIRRHQYDRLPALVKQLEQIEQELHDQAEKLT